MTNPSPRPDSEGLFDPRFPHLDLWALTSRADRMARRHGFSGDSRADFAAEIIAAVLARWHTFDPAKGTAASYVGVLIARSASALRRDAAAQKRRPQRGHVPLAGLPELEEPDGIAAGTRIDLAVDIADLTASLPRKSSKWVVASLRAFRNSERPPRAPDPDLRIFLKVHFSPVAPIGKAKSRKE